MTPTSFVNRVSAESGGRPPAAIPARNELLPLLAVMVRKALRSASSVPPAFQQLVIQAEAHLAAGRSWPTADFDRRAALITHRVLESFGAEAAGATRRETQVYPPADLRTAVC